MIPAPVKSTPHILPVPSGTFCPSNLFGKRAEVTIDLLLYRIEDRISKWPFKPALLCNNKKFWKIRPFSGNALPKMYYA